MVDILKALNLNTIKNSIFGDGFKDSNYDEVIKNISDKIVNKDLINNVDLIKKGFSSIIDDKFDGFKEVSPNILNVWETRDRIYRYNNYDDIIDNIPYCARALRVLTDEIISPDDITKQSISILEGANNPTQDKEESDIEFIKSIIEKVEIDDLLSDIVEDTLKFGDQFVELYNQNSNDIPMNQVILNESQEGNSTERKKKEEVLREVNSFSESVKITEKITDLESGVITELDLSEVGIELLIDDDPENFIEAGSGKKNKNAVSIDNIRIIVHDPKYVIKVQSNKFKMCLGYLVVPHTNFANTNLMNANGQKGSGGLGGTSLYSHGGNNTTTSDLFGIDSLYKNLIGLVRQHLGRSTDAKLNKNEVKKILSNAIREVENIENGKLEIRFVPVDRMEHFHLGQRKFFPYGESIFHKTLFNAKLLIALMTAITIKRLSDSTERRIIYVESSRNRQDRNYIEEVKQVLQKKRYKLDDFGSISSIPSMITSFENIFIPQIRGKRPVEFDKLDPALNIQQLSDELKFFRDTLVASLDVPPSYIGLEENNSTKNTLSQESVVFSRTVVAYQKRFSKHIKGLLTKIYKYTKTKVFKADVIVVLPPPKFLQTQILADHIQSAVGIIDALETIGVPREYTRRKYLSLDWDEIEEFSAKQIIDIKLGGNESAEGIQ